MNYVQSFISQIIISFDTGQYRGNNTNLTDSYDLIINRLKIEKEANKILPPQLTKAISNEIAFCLI